MFSIFLLLIVSFKDRMITVLLELLLPKFLGFNPYWDGFKIIIGKTFLIM